MAVANSAANSPCRPTASSTSATAAVRAATSACAAFRLLMASAHTPVGRPVCVKYFRNSASIRSTNSGSLPDSAPSSAPAWPAATSSARASASHPARSTGTMAADCRMRWARQSSVSTVSSSIARTRSCASSPVSCSRRGARMVSLVSAFLWKRL
ncbi:Uncharacterised protein [Mycobacteroides abscessus subsp. abscessus]|nr:Uncharacterised protein [Mycobacteroides abscessus subsp. abscessus]